METQEIILVESSATASIQNNQTETVINVNDDIINNPIYKLYEQQEKEFGEFGKQMNLHIRDLFKEILINQNKKIEAEIESINSKNSIDVEDIRKKFDEIFVSQSSTIESLNVRVEGLETDSIINDQDIEKFKQEFDIFKKKSRLSLKTPPAQNNVSLNMNDKIHEKISEFVIKHKNNKFKDNTFKYLKDDFTIDNFLEYEKSYLFYSLNDDIKKSVKLTINELLKNELTFKKRKLTQPVNVYIDRKLVPSLPPGVKSYNEFQETREFDLLPKNVKVGIRKLILTENLK
ncbi:hypothetical protein RclHR1_01550002 [Rhizophagus clarus]|uniref:Uncharacterized protein n=1 Tax=Rhizophagus clarus TaxID=94130 RepID=A0A2Z6R7Y3_9GLOM|nr:hypothetical protein RclHR1_01550002 [Rhizophagus clarus]GET01170.1 hypothetical protein GLOIN_2v1673184 [Rhizophagus clarus]